MYEILLVIYLIVALSLIGLVLIQQGKGADMGASFGSGASNTVFGSGGSGSFLTRATAISAALFILISLAIGNLSARQGKPTDTFSDLTVPVVEQVVPVDSDVPVTSVSENDIPQ